MTVDKRTLYTAAVLQGMMTAEHCDVTYPESWLAERAVEIVNAVLEHEEGQANGTLSAEPPAEEEGTHYEN